MSEFVETFKASYHRALNNRVDDKTFFDHFYELFVAKSPNIFDRFVDTNMARQKNMLKDSFDYVIDYFITEKANEKLHYLAKVHSKAGKDIPPEFYDVWMDSLLETARDFDPLFNRSVALAWRMALSPGITYMKFLYEK